MRGKLRNWIKEKLKIYKVWPLLSISSAHIAVYFRFIIMDNIIVGSDIPSNITNSEWVSFLGSYV